jgi:hypothetical protein
LQNKAESFGKKLCGEQGCCGNDLMEKSLVLWWQNAHTVEETQTLGPVVRRYFTKGSLLGQGFP